MLDIFWFLIFDTIYQISYDAIIVTIYYNSINAFKESKPQKISTKEIKKIKEKLF